MTCKRKYSKLNLYFQVFTKYTLKLTYPNLNFAKLYNIPLIRLIIAKKNYDHEIKPNNSSVADYPASKNKAILQERPKYL